MVTCMVSSRGNFTFLEEATDQKIDQEMHSGGVVSDRCYWASKKPLCEHWEWMIQHSLKLLQSIPSDRWYFVMNVDLIHAHTGWIKVASKGLSPQKKPHMVCVRGWFARWKALSELQGWQENKFCWKWKLRQQMTATNGQPKFFQLI